MLLYETWHNTHTDITLYDGVYIKNFVETVVVWKMFFYKFKKILPILDFTFSLNGALNQTTFQLLFLLVFTSVWAYELMFYTHFLALIFLYNSFALSNSYLLQDHSSNLFFSIFGRSFMIVEGWFNFPFM